MQLFEKQLNAVYYLNDKTTTELIYGGAAGGGKSALGCLWLIANCQKYPGSRWLMGRSKLKTLKETTLNTFFEILTRFDLHSQFKYNAQNSIITHTNGSEILLKDLYLYPSDSEFDSLGSLEITGSFIDECNQVVHKAWQITGSRIRYKLLHFCDVCGDTQKKKILEIKTIKGIEVVTKWVCGNGHTTTGLIPKQLGTCNPSKSWVYKLFYSPNKTGELPKQRKFIQALPNDNPFLPDSYIEALEQLNEASKERLLKGNWEYDDDKSSIISYDAIMDYWNGQHVKKTGQVYLTIDVARKGKDASIFRVWNGFVCIKRISMAISLVTEVANQARKLQSKFGITNSNTIADEDGVGGGVVDILGCNGFINNSKPMFKENYTNLKTQCSVIMAKRIQRKEVSEECNDQEVIERTSEEMEQIKYKDIDKDAKIEINNKDAIKSQIGRSPDDWDSIMMREWFEFGGDFFID